MVKRLEFSQIALPQRLTKEQAPLAVRVLCQAFHDYPVMRWVLGTTDQPPVRPPVDGAGPKRANAPTAADPAPHATPDLAPHATPDPAPHATPDLAPHPAPNATPGPPPDLAPTPAPDYARRLGALIGFFVGARLLRGEPVLGLDDGNTIVAVALLSDPQGPAGPAGPPALAAAREALWAELGAAARERYDAFGRAASTVAVDVPRVHLNMIGVRPALRGYGYSTHLLDEVHRIARVTEGARGVSLTTEDPANLPLYARFGYEVVGEAVVEGPLRTWGLFRPN